MGGQRYGPGMRTCDGNRLSLCIGGLVIVLSGVQPGCGSTTTTPAPEAQPSSPSDSNPDLTSDTGSAGSSPAPGGSTSARDAATTTASKRDGATAVAPATDAAIAKAADAATVLDAGATGSPRDAAIASGIDAAVAPQQHDAALQPLDAQVDATIAHVVHVDSKDEWTASGFQVQAGKCYTINTKIDDKWLDLDVPADLSGWTDKSDFRYGLFAPFRRVVQDDIGFYQFATCVDKKLDQCFPVGTTSNICPKVSGELYFFCNDVPGFESNDVGTATVTLQAK